MVGASCASLADGCRSERRFSPLAVMRFGGALAAPLTLATTESQYTCLQNFLFERAAFSFSASGIQIHELTGTSAEEVESRLDLLDLRTAKPPKSTSVRLEVGLGDAGDCNFQA